MSIKIARQIVCCKCTARHPPPPKKVGHADIMVELGRNTYLKYRMKISLNEHVYLTNYRNGHTRYIFLCINLARQYKSSLKNLTGSKIEGTTWNQDKLNNYTRYKMSIARQTVFCIRIVRHPPKVGLVDIMVELGRNTY